MFGARPSRLIAGRCSDVFSLIVGGLLASPVGFAQTGNGRARKIKVEWWATNSTAEPRPKAWL